VRGQVTDPEHPLFRVGDLARLWLTVHAFERDAVRMAAGSQARVTLPALPGRALTGTVTHVGHEVEVSSRTIPVRIDLENPGDLRPGMSATAWIPVGDRAETVVAVPSASLQRMQDGWVVFVPRDARTFERRPVGRGRDLGGEVEILSGVKPGEEVVVEGAFLLKAEAEKAGGQGDHHAH
jgi:cobalt-zinc-cadmium efflux system membrane fusion protein